MRQQSRLTRFGILLDGRNEAAAKLHEDIHIYLYMRVENIVDTYGCEDVCVVVYTYRYMWVLLGVRLDDSLWWPFYLCEREWILRKKDSSIPTFDF